MQKPNYKDGSIPNLMASIGSALGHKSKYKSLKILNPKELKDSKNIILIIIDGLGYEYLMKNGEKTIFKENLKGKITSVFPSSTSSAIPTFFTGLAPSEHEMTGWFMYLEELGTQIIPLPFVQRLTKEPLNKKLNIREFFTLQPFADKIKTRSYLVQKKEILNSDFTIAVSGKAKREGYKSDKEKNVFNIIKKILKTKKQKKFIYAYYPEHDTICHDKGSTSKKALKNFKSLDRELKTFLKSIKNTNTTIIITSDHGITDVNKIIDLRNHPKLKETLIMPICGEHRFAYCYVKPSKTREFENYIKTRLKHACTLHKNKNLVKKGFFGPNPTKRFLRRIGDYTILMKENYGIYDSIKPKKKIHPHIGDHGGISKEEIYVPLIIIKT